jgi:hypothetical protein
VSVAAEYQDFSARFELKFLCRLKFVIKYCHQNQQRTLLLKLRILDNSIRLRLNQSEVERVNTEGLVKGQVRFAGSNAFSYVLESSPATVKPEAHVSNNVLTVRIPQPDIRQWAESEQVSISSEQNLDAGEQLKILVEKDFACLSPREGEDESDMFPHPDADRKTC